MNNKRVLKYQIISYILIIIIVAIGIKVEDFVMKKVTIDFSIWFYYLGNGFKHLLAITVGVLLGLDRFLIEKNRLGKWKFYSTRLVIVSILPTFYVLRYLSIVLGFLFKISIPFAIYKTFGNVFLASGSQGENLMMVILGFVFITSFYKEKEITIESQVQ